MCNIDHNDVKNIPKMTTRNSTETETDFGNRKISDQNFSKIIALPKTALMNCGNPVKVSVKLVQEGETRYIKLTPIEYKDLEEL
jgi:hypothetical protein